MQSNVQSGMETLMTKIFMLVGVISGAGGFADFDLALSIILKLVSIVSFLIIIIINLEKFCEKIKHYYKKLKK